MLAPGGEDESRPEGVVERPPGVVQRRGADPQALGAQDPDRDAEQEQQLGRTVGAARLGIDPDGGGDGCGVDAGELTVGASNSPWQR